MSPKWGDMSETECEDAIASAVDGELIDALPRKCMRCDEPEDDETVLAYDDSGRLLCHDCTFMDFCETMDDLEGLGDF